MTLPIHRHHLENYLTFHYEYLPQIRAIIQNTSEEQEEDTPEEGEEEE